MAVRTVSISRGAVRRTGGGVKRYGLGVAIGGLLLIAATVLLTRPSGVRSLLNGPIVARPQPSRVTPNAAVSSALESHGPAATVPVLAPHASTAADAAGEFEAALLAARQLTDPTARDAALLAACRHYGRQFPAEAVGFARELGLDEVPGAGFDDLVQDWAEHDPMAALAWVERDETGAAGDRLLSRVVFSWAQADPARAIAAVMFHFESERARTDAVISVLHQWALREPKVAAIWAHGLTAGPLRTRALDELEALHP